ncbi:MAG TPA: hypothetical protein VM096_06620, partial [Vicinamibacterales bacterium]|nr:hypothetical protein [Vicinamibacterales bacterium]
MLRSVCKVAFIATAVVASASAAANQSAATARPAAANSQAAGPAGQVKPAVAHPSTTATMLPAEQTALVKTYCAGCHTDRGKDRTGGVSFQAFDAAKLEDNGEVTERMIRKLRSG